MARAVLLRAGARFLWVGAEGPLGGSVSPATPEEAVESFVGFPASVDPGLLGELRARRPEGPIGLAEPSLGGWSAELGPVEAIGSSERRGARERGWPKPNREEKAFYLGVARRRLADALASPEESLVTLAREEERLERVVRREEEAAHQLLDGGGPRVDSYRRAGEALRTELRAHQSALQRSLEDHARTVAPQLSAVVGARVAARLIARGGGVAALARMTASRLQLLGSRRRPGAGRGPRFGLIYRAARMEEVPPSRQGAYARSLAALAAIAVRIDAHPGAEGSTDLVLRRDRRVRALQTGRS